MGPGGTGYGGQDEASFVQNFAVQQQPFFFGGYPYLGGFSPFANPLYSQFGYFGQPPFADPQSFVALNNQQNFFGMPADGLNAGNAPAERGDKQDGGGVVTGNNDLLMNVPGVDSVYSLYQHQLGNALANLSLQDVQDQQRLLQQQLYQQQLLIQQQQLHQQLHQHLLLHTQQLSMQNEGQDASASQDSQDSQDPQNTLGFISNTQLQQQQQIGQQDTEQKKQSGNKDQETKDRVETNAKEDSTEGHQAESTQKQKQDGPRSWADIISAKNNSAVVSTIPPTSSTTTTTTTTTTSTAPAPTNTNTASTPVTTSNATVPTAGPLVLVKPTHSTKLDDSNRNKQPPLKVPLSSFLPPASYLTKFTGTR